MRPSEHSQASLEAEISALWRQVLGVDKVDRHDDFTALGGTPSLGARLVELMEQRFDLYLHLPWLVAAPTVAEQAEWLLTRCLSGAARPEEEAPPDPSVWREHWRQVFDSEPEPKQEPSPGVAPPPGDPRVAFLLSPGRSGSTLLRIMLAGHPGLFAPPEIELLLFRDIQARSQGLREGWFDFLGLERTVMELWGIDESQARALVADWRNQNISTREVYRSLQQRLGARLLVDKSPSYAISRAALRRAEAWFEGALYIHLTRHPLASIRSWKNSNFDQVLHAPPHEAAEMDWLVTHENILDLCQQIPPQRYHRLKYEDLVRHPEAEMRRLCQFLEVAFDPAVVSPYQGGRMTERIGGLVSGDKGFYRRNSIDPASADGSRRLPGDGPLTEDSIRMARLLGYGDL